MERSDELWSVIPRKHLAATLLILFDGPQEKEVVLTVRALGLRSYPGEVSLPGGKADASEDWWATAFREASEEIGFDAEAFDVEQVAALPAHLSRHFLYVRPCVVNVRKSDGSPVVLADLAPRINADEVLCVFSAPLSTFLSTAAMQADPAETEWAGSPWYFYVFGFDKDGWIFANENDAGSLEHTTVTGLTAHMLVDCARHTYGRTPEFGHVKDLGFLVGVEWALATGRFMPRI